MKHLEVKHLVIRADGSQHLGLGHVMRCIAFAQGLERAGVRSIFVTREYEPKVAKIIQRYNYSMEPIPKSCSFQEDLLLTSQLADQHNAKLIVTDLCHIGTIANLDQYGEYLQGLKNRGKFLITIDDLNEMRFPSDIVINPNCGAENRNYESNKSTKFLLGPAYFIFRQEFIEAARKNREIIKEAQNILVTVGGSDPLNLTVKVAKALCKLENASKLNLCIVLGINYPNSAKQELKESLRSFEGKYELLQGSNNLAELMLWSDLAITGGGLTKYETAVTGTPSIIMSQAAHHAKVMERFEKEKTSLHLGISSRIKEEDIVAATARLLRDDTLRAEMSRRGKRLVDGKGIERILSEIPREVFL